MSEPLRSPSPSPGQRPGPLAGAAPPRAGFPGQLGAAPLAAGRLAAGTSAVGPLSAGSPATGPVAVGALAAGSLGAGSLGAVWISRASLHVEALDALAELNEQCLELICEQAACSSGPRPPFLSQLEPLWAALDPAARRRAARCPFLLVELGFAKARLLPWLAGGGIRDEPRPAPRAAFFTVPRTITVTRLVLAYAWHLTRSEGVAARLFLGLPPHWIERIGACTLRQVMQLAESEPGMLDPRWAERAGIWRELLIAAATGEPCALELVGMRGLQLLAAECGAGRARLGRA